MHIAFNFRIIYLKCIVSSDVYCYLLIDESALISILNLVNLVFDRNCWSV